MTPVAAPWTNAIRKPSEPADQTEAAPAALASDKRPEYVCGFMFSPDHSLVLLIKKQRPAWQLGRLNGIGGKVEPDETPEEAMRRECREETGLDCADWVYYVSVAGRADGFIVHFFVAIGDVKAAKTITDEEVIEAPVAYLSTLPLVRGLSWLIPLALEGQYRPFVVVDELFER